MAGRTLLVVAAVLVFAVGALDRASAGMAEIYRTDDWATEKHVPVIECPSKIASGEPVTVTVSVGKEIAHPNTTTHHIRWIRLYFVPDKSTIPYEVASFDLAAHGESVLGADTSTLYTQPKVTVEFVTGVSGTFYAASYCNIHGLWESFRVVAVE